MIQTVLEHILGIVKPRLYQSNAVIGDLPSRQLNCVSVKPIDGYPSVYYFGMKSSEEPLIEIVVRNADYQVGQTNYEAIKKTLDKYHNDAVGIDSCFLTGSPGYLGADANGFHEWHMIFHITMFERSDN